MLFLECGCFSQFYSEREAKAVVIILLDAIAHLHERQIVHRDLK